MNLNATAGKKPENTDMLRRQPSLVWIGDVDETRKGYYVGNQASTSCAHIIYCLHASPAQREANARLNADICS